MLCLAQGGSGGERAGQSWALGHQRCHHVTAVVVRVTLNINLTGGDWDSPGEII